MLKAPVEARWRSSKRACSSFGSGGGEGREANGEEADDGEEVERWRAVRCRSWMRRDGRSVDVLR